MTGGWRERWGVEEQWGAPEFKTEEKRARFEFRLLAPVMAR